jgi:hypothetical protein
MRDSDVRLNFEERIVIQIFILWLVTWALLLALIFVIPFETMPMEGKYVTGIGAAAALVFAFAKMWLAQRRMMPILRRKLKKPD